MGKPIIFSDGAWQGKIGEECTDESISCIANAFALSLKGNTTRPQQIAVGYDGRKDSKRLATIFSDVLLQSGYLILFSDKIIPTPVLAYAVRHFSCIAGAMITGGNNSFHYNGVKLKSAECKPFDLEAQSDAQEFLTRSPNNVHHTRGTVTETNFLLPYLKYLESVINYSSLREFALKPGSNASVMIDSMGGAGQMILEDILCNLEWRAQTLFGTPEPTFYDRVPHAIEENLYPLKFNVSVTDALLGIATDGDVEQFSIVFEDGSLMSEQETLHMLTWYLQEKNLEKTATNRDGILAGLLFAEMIATTGKPLHEISVASR